jgi:hypothetical protein
MQAGKSAWLLLGAAGGAMFGEGTLGFYASKKMVIKVKGGKMIALWRVEGSVRTHMLCCCCLSGNAWA